MSCDLTPYEVALRITGGAEPLAEVIGLSSKATYAFAYPAKTRDAGDFPSMRYVRKLLTWARAHGVPLTADHLIFGASEAEVSALMAAPASAQVAAE